MAQLPVLVKEGAYLLLREKGGGSGRWEKGWEEGEGSGVAVNASCDLSPAEWQTSRDSSQAKGLRASDTT